MATRTTSSTVSLLGILTIAMAMPWAVARADHGHEAQPTSSSAAQQEVRGVIDAFYAAADKRDWEATGDLMADDFVIYIDGGESFGKEAYVTILKSDDIVVESLKLHNMQISVSADRSMAWSRYQAEVVSHSQGERHDVSTLETLVFQREGDRWLIRHAHVALAPLAAASANVTSSSTGSSD